MEDNSKSETTEAPKQLRTVMKTDHGKLRNS